MRLVERLGFTLQLTDIGVRDRDSIMAGIVEVEGTWLAVDHVRFGAELHHIIMRQEPIGNLDSLGLPRCVLALDDMTEDLSASGDCDGAVIHVANLEGDFTCDTDSGDFFVVAHVFYSNECLRKSSFILENKDKQEQPQRRQAK